MDPVTFEMVGGPLTRLRADRGCLWLASHVCEPPRFASYKLGDLCLEYGKLISLTANWGEQLAHEVMLGRAIEFTVRVNNLEHTFEIGSSGSWLPWIGVSRLRGDDSLDIVKRSQVQQWLLEFARAADVSCIVESTCLFLQESKWAVWDQGVLHVFTAPGKEDWTSLRRIYVHDGLGADVRGHEVNFVGHQARFGYREYEFPFGPELNSWNDR